MFIETEIRGDFMRAVVQRVNSARVEVEGNVVGSIDKGILVLLGVEELDTDDDIKYLAEKVCNLRIFDDEEGKMNLSLIDVGGELLVVSQFTLYGDCRKGRRPNYMMAAKPDYAEKMYLEFVEECKKYIKKVEKGQFQAYMKVNLENDGPVTLLLDSKKNF
ncbi:MAG: D-tyrosyl-tRNA(Tyr) deacylase [Caloramator sp.]|jgi:D-tyrosyl-tRNA(Tyr) deacylase|uniref:D-aminoacyl-tRNA deacylase n=2 Tax=Clostridiaceae TaxID=31979 RepID=A0A1M4WRZ8_9CLOT|nr:D-tyrosyl-tRNA(Tyr) deacylase [Caloramator sp.]SHE83980.1 D-tyrosyl-tRNA(Tyr) deacylase [Caloramator proteoclasticus DSM 10124]